MFVSQWCPLWADYGEISKTNHDVGSTSSLRAGRSLTFLSIPFSRSKCPATRALIKLSWTLFHLRITKFSCSGEQMHISFVCASCPFTSQGMQFILSQVGQDSGKRKQVTWHYLSQVPIAKPHATCAETYGNPSVGRPMSCTSPLER